MLNLNDREWKAFKVKDIFSMEKCKCSNASTLKQGAFPYVGATNKNNGIMDFVEKKDEWVTKGNCIVFICDGQGSVGYSIYKKEDFIGSTTLKVGRSEHLNQWTAQFLVSALDKNRPIYSYGYKRNENRLSNESIMLPTSENGQPDYAFMEQYIKEREDRLKQKFIDFIDDNYNIGGGLPNLEEKTWKEFFICDIFSLESTSSGIDGNKLSKEQGSLPYLTRTDLNNGYKSFVGKQADKYKKDSGNCITIGLDTQTAFYQPHSFYTGQNIQVLKNDNLNKYNAMFFIPLLHNAMGSLNWGGNGATLGRLKKKKIVVPIAADGQPDFAYMEQYIKAIMFSKYKKYLEYQNCLIS